MWLTPTPPVFVRVYAMGVKKVKVNINANDFEIFETQAVMPLNVEEKYGSFKNFKKEYKKWTEAKQNVPIYQV